jgi:hydrogenase/urease accessory protein HupE
MWLVVGSGSARAHPFAPVVLEVRERAGGILDLEFRRSPVGPTAQIRGSVPWPETPEGCSRVDSAGPNTSIASASIGGRTSASVRRIRLQCAATQLEGLALKIHAPPSENLVLVHHTVDGQRATRVVANSTELRLGPQNSGDSVGSGFASYLGLGFVHVLLGPDHLLFVLCLLLMTRGLRRRLLAITAFTVAHSITLVLATLELVSVPSQPVEAAIALSVVLLAGEIARGNREPSSRSLVSMVMIFGLLHGLGFAGALGELGVGAGSAARQLLGFNVGVELGQLAFVAAVLTLLRFGRRFAGPAEARLGSGARWKRRSAYAIGTIAATLFVERVVSFWGA